MNRPHLLALAIVASAVLFTVQSEARKKSESLVDTVVIGYEANESFTMPASGAVEVAFSPNEGSEALVVKVINSAKTELRVLSYSFTSAPVTAALLRAKKRGVDVRVVADRKNNVSEERSGKSRAALSALVDAGIEVRVIGVYPIHHDKVIVADRQTVELGSFNYSDVAARKNSENVFVNWGNAKLAEVYLKHFERNYRQATAYEMRY
jgi:phosphatidylserine/phosphatidylglycerophosphate/cardiolipin synthase-like enzyme